MKKNILAKVLTIAGGIAMAAGALDPMEGSLLIFPGSGLLALGLWLGDANRRTVAYKVAAFALLAISFAAVWGFTFVGGTNSASGISLMVAPYIVGWNLAIWGPGSPRWLLWLGAVTGALFLGLAAFFLIKHTGIAPIFGTFGIIPLFGCIARLKQTNKPAPTAVA